MKLYVMRHGYAGDPSDDPKKERDRPLLAEGRTMALTMAEALGDLGEVPKVIFSSPFARAIQTADIVGKTLGVQVNVIGDLAPVRPLEGTISDLISSDSLKRVMIVGHKDNTTPAMNTLGGDVKWDDLVMAEVRRVEINRDTCEWKWKFRIRPSKFGLKDYDS